MTRTFKFERLVWPLLTLYTAIVFSMSSTLPTTYGILLFNGFENLDVFGPLEYINALPNAKVYFITEEPADTVWSWLLHPTMAGLHALGENTIPQYTINNAPPIDVLVVPGGPGTRRILNGDFGPSVAWIRSTYPNIKYLIGICTGNALVAASGVLDGRNATGNKRSWSFVTSQGPNVNWVPSARWVVDGNIWSSSGVEAGTDAMHAFVSAIYGSDLAKSIANTIEHIPNEDSSYDPFATLYNTTGTLIPPPTAPAIPASAPTNVAMLVYPGFSSIEVWGSLETLHFSVAAINLTLVGKTMDPVHSNILLNGTVPLPMHAGGRLPRHGQYILPTATLKNATAAFEPEVLIVPGAPRVPFDPEFSKFIAEMYPKVRYLISFGTGAALVAQSGVAKHERATTSKYFYDAVKLTHPQLQWVPSARWVVSDNGKYWSTSGGMAVLDGMYGFYGAVQNTAASTYDAQSIEYIPHTDATLDPFASIWHTS